MPGCAFPLIMMVFLLPLFFMILFFNITAISFAKLGLTSEGAFLLLLASLIGGMINIPITKQKYIVEQTQQLIHPFIFYTPPRVREQVIAINVGGAIIPVTFSLYLLPRAPFVAVLVTTIVVTLVAKALARPVPGVGIRLPAFIPPIVSAIMALALAGHNAAPVAYIAGVLGTLIGADLLNYHRFREMGAQMLSIGGAGLFDGIFLVGVIAALLA